MELLKEIKRLVKEELGISDEVKEHVSKIFKDIITDAKIRGKNEKPNVKTGQFVYRIDDVSICVKYKVMYLNDMSEFDTTEYVASSDFLNRKYLNLVTTLVYDRSQNKYIDFDGTLQHEFEHIYQQMKSGKPLTVRRTSNEIYEQACELIHDGNTNLERVVGYAVYYNCKFEKDAYANDMYKNIMDNELDDPYTIVKNSLTYRNVNAIKHVVLDKDNSEKIAPIVKNVFGKTYNWFHRIATHMVKEYNKKIGKALTKAIKDIEEKNKKNNTLDGGRLSIRFKELTEDLK